VSELYRLSRRRRLSPKLVPTFADRGCCVVSATETYGLILGSRPEPLLFFQAASQLYSRGWVDPVPDPLLHRKSGSAGNRTRTSGTLTIRPQRRSLFRMCLHFPLHQSRSTHWQRTSASISTCSYCPVPKDSGRRFHVRHRKQH
jgi:hypothetical protein